MPGIPWTSGLRGNFAQAFIFNKKKLNKSVGMISQIFSMKHLLGAYQILLKKQEATSKAVLGCQLLSFVKSRSDRRMLMQVLETPKNIHS
jgi:hypothetical protein